MEFESVTVSAKAYKENEKLLAEYLQKIWELEIKLNGYESFIKRLEHKGFVIDENAIRGNCPRGIDLIVTEGKYIITVK